MIAASQTLGRASTALLKRFAEGASGGEVEAGAEGNREEAADDEADDDGALFFS